MTSCKGLEGLQVATVSLEQVIGFEQQGWQMWGPPKSPHHLVTSKDPRKVERTEDVTSIDNPFMHSAGFLKENIEILNRHKPFADWRPGGLLSPEWSSSRFNHLPSSFFLAAHITNPRLETSNGRKEGLK